MNYRIYMLAAALTVMSCGEGSGPARESLAVVLSGSGTGTVTSAPAGITCGATCSAQFDRGATVTLTAAADPTSSFTGWQAEGCGTATTCVVTLSVARSVTAIFALRPQLTVTKAGAGSGTVTSVPAGIDCGAACSARFDAGTVVTLTASAPAGSTFAGWSGEGCSGAGSCAVTMTAARAVTATFDPVFGPPSQIVVVSGENQSALAGTQLSAPIRIAVRDEFGHDLPGQTVTFTVIRGNGSLAASTATTGSDGTATLPPWTLGKRAEPQVVRATVDGIAADISATVFTQYNITLRLSATPEQRVLFNNAAARISAVVTTELRDADARGGVDLTPCGLPGETLDEIIDDVMIFGAIKPIDGRGKILAQAGPCLIRLTDNGNMTAVGVMTFDSDDLETLTAAASLEDVITHEMLHVVGIGTLWQDRNLIVNGAYAGPAAARECRAVGGDIACASGVPLENQGGSGTVNAHWRESTFNTELMTGFLDSGANPFSRITIGGLEDLGFDVNYAAFDPYTIFNNTALRAGPVVRLPDGWERTIEPIGVLEVGRVRPLSPAR